MKPFVEVQFSGNAKCYSYLIPDNDIAMAAAAPGVRVVVINKVKEDGTVSLSIANVVNVGETSDEQAAFLVPFVQVIDPAALAIAKAAQASVVQA